MKIKHIVIYVVALVFAVFITYRTAHHDYYNAITVTGATPKAVAKKVPADFFLTIDGMVKKTYSLPSSALRAFATARIRTKEVSTGGDFQGTYIYAGIPVFNILEGIAPAFPDESLVNTPTDFLVTFTSDSGEKVDFSYGGMERIPAGAREKRTREDANDLRHQRNDSKSRCKERITRG